MNEKKLYRKSTHPHIIYRSLTSQDEVNIVQLRNKKRYTAEKIKRKLVLTVLSLTIHRILKRYNLVSQYGYHRRPRFQDTVHLHIKNTHEVGYLQMGVKYLTPKLTGLAWTCFEYTVIDIPL